MAGRHRAPAPAGTPWPVRVLCAAAAGAFAVGGGAAAAALADTGGPLEPPAAAPAPATAGATTTTAPTVVTSTVSAAPSPASTAPPSTTTTTVLPPEPTVEPERPPAPAPEPEPEREPEPVAEQCPTSLARTVPHVAQAGHLLARRFGIPLSSIGGREGRSRNSDHPSGHALDFMVNRATGDDLADFILDNQAELGVTYLIWRQRYNSGSGWDPMDDRGSATANHLDHVHVSFARSAPDGALSC